MRTTAALVKTIIEVDENISSDLVPFITVANELVTECCADAGYTDARLELIERWLAAHFYSVRDPRAKTESAGSVGATYFGEVGKNLSLTFHGQQAMLLDTEGGLAALNASIAAGGKRTVGVTWIGTEETVYDA